MAVLFSDDFESGDFTTKWTAEGKTVGEVTSIVDTAPHQGIYNASYYCNGSVAGEYAYWYKEPFDGGAVALCYMRAYFRFLTALPANNAEYYTIMAAYNSGTEIGLVGVYNDGGTIKWQLTYRDGAGTVDIRAAPGPVLNRWYCVEMYVKVNAGNGETILFIDGVDILSKIGGFDNSGAGNVQAIVLGELSSNGQTEHTIWADEVIVADQYTGLDSLMVGTIIGNAVLM